MTSKPIAADHAALLGAILDQPLSSETRAEYERQASAVYLRDLKRQLATGETALSSVLADGAIYRERLLIQRGSPEYRRLCHRLARAQIETLEQAAEREVR
jgi:hypothetical protein